MFDQTLAIPIICYKCGGRDEKIFEEESIEI